MLCLTHWIQRRWPPTGTVPWVWAIPTAHTQIEAGPDTRPNPPPRPQQSLTCGYHAIHRVLSRVGLSPKLAYPLPTTRFGPREAGDGEMRQGATGRRQGGDRKTTGWRQEDDRPAAGKRQGSDRKRQAGDRKAIGEVRQEGDRRATGRRQGGDRETTGKRQETRHSDRISDRKATGRRQEGNRASGDREATGKRQEKATGERQESDRRATGERQGVFLRQEGDRKATGRRQESDRPVEDNKWDKIVHGFLYSWIYVKKMRTNVLHLFGFL